MTEETETAGEPIARDRTYKGERIDWSLVKLTIGYLAADYLARSMPFLLGRDNEHGLIIGGVVSLILAAFVLQRHPSLRPEIGLTLEQKPGSVLMCIIAFSSSQQ